ncbi:MAG: phosphate acetyltransferase, partial [Campylobacteraceae bacterium]|nr:phosphate acetyltransferase [Campylobacteraceae bacterium]
MKTKSLYISSLEPYSGSFVISMGFMEILRRRVKNIAFFRPIAPSKKTDNVVSFMLEYYDLKMDFSDAVGFSVEEVKSAAAEGKLNELMQSLITKFKTLEKNYDFVLCEGIARSLLSSVVDFDINFEVAKNLGAPLINILNGTNRTNPQLLDEIKIESKAIKKSGCNHFNTFINRLNPDTIEQLEQDVKQLENSYPPIYLLPEVEELSSPTIEEIKNALDCKLIFGKESDLKRVVKQTRVISTTIDTMLLYLQENDLVITGGDRSDIILGVLAANNSGAYPTVAGILLIGDILLKESFLKLIKGFSKISLPILSISGDTLSAVLKTREVPAQITINNERKIALAMGLFSSRVNTEDIEKYIDTASNSTSMTPIMFEYNIFEMARKNKKRIVLPESNDDRILRAAEIIIRRDVADIILLGKVLDINKKAASLGIDISKAVIIDPAKSPLMDGYVKEFYELRKSKGVTMELAKDAMQGLSYFATMMVYKGDADGMVSGAVHTTSDTIRPALQIIKTKQGISIISSIFFMCLDTKVLVYGDCAV